MPEERQYGKWSREELFSAEAAACRFLEENSAQIAETMRTKARFLDSLIQRLSQRQTSFADRLECLARIGEVARLIQDDADGLFGLASQPAVARLLGTVPQE
jgi:hypothetical protein